MSILSVLIEAVGKGSPTAAMGRLKAAFRDADIPLWMTTSGVMGSGAGLEGAIGYAYSDPSKPDIVYVGITDQWDDRFREAISDSGSSLQLQKIDTNEMPRGGHDADSSFFYSWMDQNPDPKLFSITNYRLTLPDERGDGITGPLIKLLKQLLRSDAYPDKLRYSGNISIIQNGDDEYRLMAPIRYDRGFENTILMKVVDMAVGELGAKYWITPHTLLYPLLVDKKVTVEVWGKSYTVALKEVAGRDGILHLTVDV